MEQRKTTDKLNEQAIEDWKSCMPMQYNHGA